MSAADKKFVMAAAQGGMAEVSLGKLASTRAMNDAVRQFGERMVQDHGSANQELKQLAASKGIALPAATSTAHRKTAAKLSGITGADFDRSYVAAMVRDHEKDVAAFRKEANQGQDPEIKAWAAQKLPTLEEHLQMIREIQGRSASGTDLPAKPTGK